MESLLIYYLIVWRPLGYILAFLGTALEGEAVWFIFSFLTSQGFFDLIPMALVVFFGALVGDLFFCFLGRHVASLPEKIVLKVNKLAGPLDSHLKKRPLRTLIISKFTYGVHRAILTRYGMLKLPYLDLIKYDIPAVILWMLPIALLGHLSGASFYLLKEYFKYAEVGILLGLVIFFIIVKFITRRSIKEL